jgi:hypothetical protein
MYFAMNDALNSNPDARPLPDFARLERFIRANASAARPGKTFREALKADLLRSDAYQHRRSVGAWLVVGFTAAFAALAATGLGLWLHFRHKKQS